MPTAEGAAVQQLQGLFASTVPALHPPSPAPNFLTRPPDDFVTDDEWADHPVALEAQILCSGPPPLSDATVLTSDDADGRMSDAHVHEERAHSSDRAAVEGGAAADAPQASSADMSHGLGAAGSGTDPIGMQTSGHTRGGRRKAAGQLGPSAGPQQPQPQNGNSTWHSVQDFKQHWATSAKLQARSLKSIACMSRSQTALLAKLDSQRAADTEQLKGLIMSVQAAANWAQQVHSLNMELSVYKNECAQRQQAWVHVTQLLQEREAELMLLRNDYEFFQQQAKHRDTNNKDLLDRSQAELTEVTEQLMTRTTECRELRARIASLEAQLHSHMDDPRRHSGQGEDGAADGHDGPASSSGSGGGGSSHGASAGALSASEQSAIMRELRREIAVGQHGEGGKAQQPLSTKDVDKLIQKSARLSAKFLKQWKEEHNKVVREKETQLNLSLQRCRRLEASLKELEAAQEAARQLGFFLGPTSSVPPMTHRHSQGSDGQGPAGGAGEQLSPWMRQVSQSARFPASAVPAFSSAQRHISSGTAAADDAGVRGSDDGGAGPGSSGALLHEMVSLDAETVQVAQHEVQLVHAELKGTKAELSAVQMQLSAAQSELVDAQGELARAQAELLRAQAQAQEAETAKQEAETAQGGAAAASEEAAQQVAQLQGELAGVQAQLQEARQKLEEQAAQLRQAQDAAAAASAASTAASATAAATSAEASAAAGKQLQQAEAALQELQKEREVVRLQNQELQQQVTELQQQVAEQTQQLAEREVEMGRVRSDLGRVRSELDAEREMHEAVLEELTQANQRLAESRTRQGEAQREVAALKQQRDTAALELAEAHQHIQRLEDELAAMQEEMDRVRAELQHAQQQLSAAQAAAAASEAEVMRLKHNMLRAGGGSKGSTPPMPSSPYHPSKAGTSHHAFTKSAGSAGGVLPPLAPGGHVPHASSQPAFAPSSPVGSVGNGGAGSLKSAGSAGSLGPAGSAASAHVDDAGAAAEPVDLAAAAAAVGAAEQRETPELRVRPPLLDVPQGAADLHQLDDQPFGRLAGREAEAAAAGGVAAEQEQQQQLQQLLQLQAQVAALAQELAAAQQRLGSFVAAARAVVEQEQRKQQQAAPSSAGSALAASRAPGQAGPASAGGSSSLSQDAVKKLADQQQQQQQQQGGADLELLAQSAAYLSFLGLLRDTEVLYTDQGSDMEPCLSRVRMLQAQLEHLLLGMVDSEQPPGSLVQHITQAAKATGLPLTLSSQYSLDGLYGSSATDGQQRHTSGRVLDFGADTQGASFSLDDLHDVHAGGGGSGPSGGGYNGGFGAGSGMEWGHLMAAHGSSQQLEAGFGEHLPGSPLSQTPGRLAAGDASGVSSGLGHWGTGSGRGTAGYSGPGMGAKAGPAASADVLTDDLLGDLDGSAWELPEFEPPPDFS